MCSRICFYFTHLEQLNLHNQRRVFHSFSNVSWSTRVRWFLEIPKHPVTFDTTSATFSAVSVVFLSSLMQEKWFWEAGMKKTNTSSLPAVGSLTTPKKNGTNTQWVYYPLNTLCWKSWQWNGQGWAKGFSAAPCLVEPYERSSVILM